MKIYTKTGDAGDTSLYGGERRSKAALRVQAYGEVDELQAHLGVVRSLGVAKDLDTFLDAVQQDCFVLSSMLARTEGAPAGPVLTSARVEWLEEMIDTWTANLPELRNFILQGGVPQAAHTYLARAVCRRAERSVVALHGQEAVDEVVLTYLNRLSDALFTLARLVNHEAGRAEAIWKG